MSKAKPVLSGSYVATLSLQKLRLKLHIGVTAEERNIPQDIEFSFRFFFRELPEACMSDAIADTICYEGVTKAVQEFCKAREFRLVEALCYQTYQQIRPLVPEAVKCAVKVKKCCIPLGPITNSSSSFEYSDAGE